MSQFHFDPATYPEFIRDEIPQYDELQSRLAAATGTIVASSILDLGTGTGETLAHVLPMHPAAQAVGVDENDGMLSVARARLAEYDIRLHVADLRDELPAGPFDLVTSALAVHHLDGPGKAELFERVAAVLRPSGRFVLADVIVPVGVASAQIELSDDYDKPSTVGEQVGWLKAAGLSTVVAWQEGDLAVFTADRPGAGH
jgi:tRNA (cmo5U34)-methyltransferase